MTLFDPHGRSPAARHSGHSGRSRHSLALRPALIAPAWLISVLTVATIALVLLSVLWFVPSAQRPALEPGSSSSQSPAR